jgi:hypothetical protein
VVTDADDLGGVDVVLDRQLPGRDHALGLVADVEEDLVAVDLDDDPFDDVAVVEVLDGLVDRREEVFLGADVVDRYLLCGRARRGRRGLVDSTEGHVVGNSAGHARRCHTAGPPAEAVRPSSGRPAEPTCENVACSV